MNFKTRLSISNLTWVLLLYIIFSSSNQLIEEESGINNPVAIGKFLNGNLPSTTPEGLGGTTTGPLLLSQTGAFANMATLEPSPGIIPYEMIEPFWSDNAEKYRWMAIPNDGSHNTTEEQIQFSADDNWVFPKGAVLIKHFELGGRRLETRFEVLGDDDVYYYLTYKWNAAQTDADLIEDAVDEEVLVNGTPQIWHYPSRLECLSCHLPEVGSVLGPKTRNLNKAITYPSTGITSNQLVTLSSLGILNATITTSNVGDFMAVAAKDDLSASLEYRARSYIDVNCSNCHQPAVTNVAMFDARITTPLENQNIIYGPVVYDEGLSDPSVIIPMDVANSMMHFRMNSLANGIQMPPLAKNMVDQEGVNLIAEWINSLTPTTSFPPEAVLSANPVFGLAPLSVTFDASGSSDQDGDNLNFTWDFGDNSGSTETIVSHVYNSPGEYTATLTVSDGQNTDETSVLITVNNSNPGSNTVSFSDSTNLLNGDNYSGVAMAVSDMNGDGKDDIIRFNQAEVLNVQYQGVANQNFTSHSIGQVSTKNQWSVCIADFDKNGFNDILCGGAYDNIKLIHNDDGNTSYMSSILSNSDIFIQGSNFVDINGDNWVDIFACHDDEESRAYRNEQNGTFSYQSSLISTETVPASDNSGNYASIWTDYDNDGDLDLYISKCRGGVTSSSDPRRINMLWQNDGNNNFTEIADQANLKNGRQTWLTDFGDIDNDGDLDAIIINHSADPNLMRNNGDGTFTDITSSSGLVPTLDPANYYGIQGLFRDFNNDGFVDLLATGDPHFIFYNNGDGTFTNAPNPFNSNGIQSMAIGDLNSDGFLDVYAGYAEGLNTPSNLKDRLWLNDGNANNFIAVQLKGNESNINGIGARIELYGAWGIQIREVRAGEGYGIMNSFTQHFGLGVSNQIDKIVVKWPSGKVNELPNPSPNQFLTIEEGVGTDFVYSRQEPYDIPAVVSFDASVSTFDISSKTLSWDFGDGNSGSGVTPNHTYADTGKYVVTLVATDNNSGVIDQVAKEIVIIEGCAASVGLPCDMDCTENATIQPDCSCQGTEDIDMDSDGDGVCDSFDQCPGGDDNEDINENDIPDCCDPALDFNFINYPVIGYDPGQDFGNWNVQDNGYTLFMEGNTWKAVEIDYTVTSNTVLTFDFKSTVEGEIHEISFDNDLNVAPNQRIVVYGNQGYDGDVSITKYSGSGDWESFKVNIGASFTGTFQYLVLSADDDGSAAGNSYFRNIIIIEDSDNDGVANSCDSCPGFDNGLIGTACDDGDPCTTNDVYDEYCNCKGEESIDYDQDGICDAIDIDWDNDGIPNSVELQPIVRLDQQNKGVGTYTVKYDGEIELTIKGGGGGGGSTTQGGEGATVTGRFSVNKGDVISYAIGEGSPAGNTSAGGGGSSGVFINQDLVMVAGGGGGGDNSGGAIGYGGNNLTNGGNGTGTNPGNGGNNGNGGASGTGSDNNNTAAGGGGILNAGGNGSNGATGGKAADLNLSDGLTLAQGGNGGSSGSVGGDGFTGGGGAGQYYSGGGGGYSGGGSAGGSGGAGGGGSFLDDTWPGFVTGGITAGANGALTGGSGVNGQDGSILIKVFWVDIDGDGLTNDLDLDSDNDGLLDIAEAGDVDLNENAIIDDLNDQGTLTTITDTDMDGVPNFIDVESTNSLNDETGPFDINSSLIAGFDTNNDGQLTDADIGGGNDEDGDGLDDMVDGLLATRASARTVNVSLKIMLQGPFNSSNGLMADDLRRLNLIPEKSPYVDSLRVAAPIVFMTDYSENSIVDWVEVELYDDQMQSIVKRSALIQRDGDIVDVNGQAALLLKNVPEGSYHILVRHRNHLGFMTDEVFSFD